MGIFSSLFRPTAMEELQRAGAYEVVEESRKYTLVTNYSRYISLTGIERVEEKYDAVYVESVDDLVLLRKNTKVV